jgi:hypothetical protein
MLLNNFDLRAFLLWFISDTTARLLSRDAPHYIRAALFYKSTVNKAYNVLLESNISKIEARLKRLILGRHDTGAVTTSQRSSQPRLLSETSFLMASTCQETLDLSRDKIWSAQVVSFATRSCAQCTAGDAP